MEKSEQPRILIVDDIKENIKTLVTVLEGDYAIVAAKNGAAAIKKAQKVETKPDLILLDIMMPEMNGYEVCRRLKAHQDTESIPIIFVTALSEAEDESKGFKAGGVDYITKPFNPVVVKERVKTHLALKEYQAHLEEMVRSRTEQLEEAKIAAQAANKAKSDFLMNMSHELRTPLNAILAYTAMITGNELEKNAIESSSYGLLETIEKILDFTKSKDGELKLNQEPFYLSEVLTNIKTQFVHKGSKLNLVPKIKIKGDIIPNHLIGDKKQLFSIVNPLLENAAKFCRHKPEAELTLKLLKKSSQHVDIQFSLKDNGIGIQKDIQNKIFAPFSQADTTITREFDGTGMGLSLCKQLVELMEGEIWVESEVDKGSTFHFTARFELQDKNEPLDIAYINNVLQDRTGLDKTSELLPVDISIVEPILKKLNHALQNSEPQNIRNCVSGIKKYKIPDISRLIEAVDEYEYEDAVSILAGIAFEIGIQI